MGKSLLITHLDGNLKDGKFAQTSVISQTLVRLLKNFFPPPTPGTINFISTSLGHSVVGKSLFQNFVLSRSPGGDNSSPNISRIL